MAKRVSLQEFVAAFSELDYDPKPDTWVLKDMCLDADELDWFFRDLHALKNWRFHWETDLSGYLPYQSWAWCNVERFADLKLRELYAYSKPTVAND